MRAFIFLIFGLVLTACATTGGGVKNIEQWQGKKAQDLTAQLGMPVMVSPEPSGNVDYIYIARSYSSYSARIKAPTTTFTGPNQTSVGINNPAPDTLPAPALQECLSIFEINRQGVIVNVRNKGDLC